MRFRPSVWLALLPFLLLAGAGCSQREAEPGAGAPESAVSVETSAPAATRASRPAGAVRIGFSMDTLEEERWHRDRELVEARARELGATIDTRVANGDDAEQKKQCLAMLDAGANVLIVVPHNAAIAASIVEAAHSRGVPVISYDRLIRNSDVDLYVSHRILRIGAMLAEYALRHAPKGNYLLIGGASSDNNALLLRRAQMEVLGPAIARGDIRIVSQQYAAEWRPEEARRITEQALAQTGGDLQAIVASNDGTAGGAIEALQAAGLAGKVLVTGQDAQKDAAQRIVRGTQAMTVYKPIKPLAASAVEAAIQLARNEPVAAPERMDNGGRQIPSILHEPVVVDRANIDATLIREGFHRREDVY